MLCSVDCLRCKQPTNSGNPFYHQKDPTPSDLLVLLPSTSHFFTSSNLTKPRTFAGLLFRVFLAHDILGEHLYPALQCTGRRQACGSTLPPSLSSFPGPTRAHESTTRVSPTSPGSAEISEIVMVLTGLVYLYDDSQWWVRGPCIDAAMIPSRYHDAHMDVHSACQSRPVGPPRLCRPVKPNVS